MAVVAVVVLVLFGLARRGRSRVPAGLVLLALVTLFCVAETGYAMSKIADTQKGVSQDFIQGRRWVDAVMPAGQHADVIASTMGDPGSAYGVWWDVSFWNRTVDRTLQLPTTPDLQQPFPQQFAFNPDGTMYDFVSRGAEPFSAGPYFVRADGDRSFAFRDEQPLAEHFGVRLVRTGTPTRAAWQLAGTVDDTGKIARGYPPTQLVVFQDRPDERRIPVRVTLGTWPDTAKGAERYVFGGRHGVLRAGQTVTLSGMARLHGDYVTLPIRALGKLDGTRGIQVLNVWVR
jgi:hypothetical protein